MSTLQKMLDHRRAQPKKDLNEALKDVTPKHPEKAIPKEEIEAKNAKVKTELNLADLTDDETKKPKTKKKK